MEKISLIIAIDSFKESLSSGDAANAFATGFKRGYSKSAFKKLLISDGGEGFTDALVKNSSGKFISVQTRDPLFRPLKAKIGFLTKNSAVVETACAAGLELLKPNERNPLKTTTYGLGLLIASAVKKGAASIMVGLGGSATNDGGTGMLQALGVRFVDSYGKTIAAPMTGASLCKIKKIDISALKKYSKIKFTAACDVTNPLTGAKGASAVFGPQKGATPQMVKELDSGLKNFAAIAGSKKDILPGSGAAGGLGFAFAEFLSAKLMPGIDIMLEACNFKSHLKNCDIVITGEGRIDGQTSGNKAPYGIAAMASRAKVPVIAVCGSKSPEADLLYKHGFSAIYSITPKPMTLDDALKNGAINMESFAESLGRTLSVLKG